MSNAFAKLLDKVSSYQLFNYLFPGIIFIEGIEYLTRIVYPNDNIIFRLFVYYIAGMILSRIGSVFIEPICKKLCVVVYASYGNYLKALNGTEDGTIMPDPKLDVLVAENNTYRTLVATFLLMLIVYVFAQFQWFYDFNDWKWSMIIYLVLLIGLFILSFRKQTAFVRSRTHSDLKLKDKEQIEGLKKDQKKVKLWKQIIG